MSQGIVPGSASGGAYSGGSDDHGSAAVAGPGHGNKKAPDGEDVDTSDTRFQMAHLTDSYSGGTKYGSAPMSGPG